MRTLPMHTPVLHIFMAIAIALLAAVQSRGEETGSPSMHLGIGAGYSSVKGHYNSELEDSSYLSLSVIPIASRYLCAEADITYSAYELSESQGSSLYSVGLNAGPLLTVTVFGAFTLYAGALARGNYLYLRAHNLDIEENALKPGFSLRGGVFFPLPHGLRLRAGVDYSGVWLSGEPMMSLSAFGGITYNIFHISSGERTRRSEVKETLERYSNIERYYAEGVKGFNEGELKSAKESFTRVLELKGDHIDARGYLERINESEGDYSRALEQIDKKNYYAAIPLLARAEKNMKDARRSLADLRAKLTPLVPDFERRGIQAYDRNNYDMCIDLMGKVQLIDPGNRTAQIYLPRAAKRREALEKLK